MYLDRCAFALMFSSIYFWLVGAVKHVYCCPMIHELSNITSPPSNSCRNESQESNTTWFENADL